MNNSIIINKLFKLEKQENIQILYACESGSRAWGFPSQDSDYDVRFIYIHEADWYLTIDLENKRDVIECSDDKLYDIVGWDLRKALQLLYKSNPPLLEWLSSPIIYINYRDFLIEFKNIAVNFFSPSTCMHHYRNIAQQFYHDIEDNKAINLKKFFYLIRSILAFIWIEKGHGIVPKEFSILCERLLESDTFKQQITELIDYKKSRHELDDFTGNIQLKNFLDEEMERINEVQINKTDTRKEVKTLNDIFRLFLKEYNS